MKVNIQLDEYVVRDNDKVYILYSAQHAVRGVVGVITWLIEAQREVVRR